jgi:hypothetical protein
LDRNLSDFSGAAPKGRHNSGPDGEFEAREKPGLKDYVTLFNAECYFEAHEVMEAVWIGRGRPARDVARALVQLAAALEQLQRGHPNGAARILSRARPVLAAARWTEWNVPCALRAAERRIARAGGGAAPRIKPRRTPAAQDRFGSEQVL